MKTKILLTLIIVSLSGTFLFAQSPFSSSLSAMRTSGTVKKIFSLQENTLNGIADAKTLFAQYKDSPDSPLVKLNMKADSNYVAPERFKTRIPQSLLAPGILIALGLTSMRG